jgi:hypothetical protein
MLSPLFMASAESIWLLYLGVPLRPRRPREGAMASRCETFEQKAFYHDSRFGAGGLGLDAPKSREIGAAANEVVSLG